MDKLKIMLLAGLLYGDCTSPVLAGNDEEKAELARLIHELDALDPVLESAEEQALTDTRIRFNYAWARRDIQAIKDGIQEYLENPGTEPRQYPPLKGDYRQ